MTVPGWSQSCVTRKIRSGVQSHHGHHGTYGHTRSASSSLAAGSTASSLSRRPSSRGASWAVSGLFVGMPSAASSLLKGSRLGCAVVRPSSIRGSRSSTGRIGSNFHARYFHHHQGQRPQHQRNLISNAPLMSVVSHPTCSVLDHHHSQSTSFAHTNAPGTGLPSAHTTRPRTTYSRHQNGHHHQKYGLIRIGSMTAFLSFQTRPGTSTAIVCDCVSSSSLALAGPTRTRSAPGCSANDSATDCWPPARTVTVSMAAVPPLPIATTRNSCASPLPIAVASSGTSRTYPRSLVPVVFRAAMTVLPLVCKGFRTFPMYGVPARRLPRPRTIARPRRCASRMWWRTPNGITGRSTVAPRQTPSYVESALAHSMCQGLTPAARGCSRGAAGGPTCHDRGPGHRETPGSSTRAQKKFGRRCREPVTGSVPAVNATKMGRTSTEEKHYG